MRKTVTVFAESVISCYRFSRRYVNDTPRGKVKLADNLEKGSVVMTRLGDFGIETLAVDSIAADTELLERLAARGGSLCEYDLKLLARCNVRLSRLLQVLIDNHIPIEPLSSPPRERPAKVRTDRGSPIRHPVNSL